MGTAAWERLYNELDSKASRLGYKPPRDLAKQDHASQCFQLEWRREPVLFFGFRDLVRIPDYSSPDHIWVGPFDPIFRAINQRIRISENPFIPPSFGIIIDNSTGNSVLVPFNHLLAVYLDREKRRLEKVENQTFAVLNRDNRYFLETSYGTRNLPLNEVNTLGPLVRVLELAKDPSTRLSIFDQFETRD